ncbi:TPA: hypothetical protein DCX16_00355 [bacterium]|nr:hypothetical protein [bacterium]
MKVFFVLFLLSGCITKQFVPSYSYKENQKALLIYERGMEFKKMGEYPNAINEFQRFIDYYDKIYLCDDAYYQIAECYKMQEQWPEAIGSYKRLINKFSRPFILLRPFVKERETKYIPEAMYKIGLSFEKKGDFLLAIKEYKKVITKHYNTEWGPLAEEGIKGIISKFPEARWAKREEKILARLIKKVKR